jgi:hypothetical protein
MFVWYAISGEGFLLRSRKKPRSERNAGRKIGLSRKVRWASEVIMRAQHATTSRVSFIVKVAVLLETRKKLKTFMQIFSLVNPDD